MNSEKRITKAIIPAAGKGTRLFPLTKALPKEMLPIGRKPVLQYIVEEIRESGINEVLFIISKDKMVIYEYFKNEMPDMQFDYVIQHEQKGLGHAIACSEEYVDGKPFAVVLGDSTIENVGKPIPLRRVIDTFESTGAGGVIVVQDTPPEEAHRYGMVKPKGDISGSFEIEDLIEKPAPDKIPGRYAIAGRYAFDASIFDFIRQTKPGAGQEIQITDAVKLMLYAGNPVWCVPLVGEEIRRDIGTFPSYFEAFVLACLADPECGDMVRFLTK